MRGYVQVPQFWYYAKTWDDLINPPKGDAEAYSSVVRPLSLELLEKQPPATFGTIVFRVEDDGRLLMVDSYFDSSG